MRRTGQFQHIPLTAADARPDIKMMLAQYEFRLARRALKGHRVRRVARIRLIFWARSSVPVALFPDKTTGVTGTLSGIP